MDKALLQIVVRSVHLFPLQTWGKNSTKARRCILGFVLDLRSKRLSWPSKPLLRHDMGQLGLKKIKSHGKFTLCDRRDTDHWLGIGSICVQCWCPYPYLARHCRDRYSVPPYPRRSDGVASRTYFTPRSAAVLLAGTAAGVFL